VPLRLPSAPAIARALDSPSATLGEARDVENCRPPGSQVSAFLHPVREGGPPPRLDGWGCSRAAHRPPRATRSANSNPPSRTKRHRMDFAVRDPDLL